MTRRLGLALVVLLAACSAEEPAPPPSAPLVERPSASPWGLAVLPDGSALVAQRDRATILDLPADGGETREAYRMPGVDAGGEGGLLGLAVAPDYEQSRWVYAYYTASGDNRIARFKLDSGDRPEVIFDGIAKAGIHNGGRIAFGPDGMLYAGTGDAGQTRRSQDPESPNGKILRLTPEGEPAPGNPDEGSPVWTLGHRNVQGLAWTANGTMYATEFGQNTFDEVNRIEKGKNYGWPEVEGNGNDEAYENPIVTWRTSEASPSGAAIVGDTLYVAALRGERLWTVPLAGGEPEAHLRGELGRLRTVAVAPDGALWVTTSNTDRGPEPEAGGDDRVLMFPPGA